METIVSYILHISKNYLSVKRIEKKINLHNIKA